MARAVCPSSSGPANGFLTTTPPPLNFERALLFIPWALKMFEIRTNYLVPPEVRRKGDRLRTDRWRTVGEGELRAENMLLLPGYSQ